MAVVGKDTLKGYFERGDRPNEEQFVDFIDSMYNKQDDHDFTADTIVSTDGRTLIELKDGSVITDILQVSNLYIGGEKYDPTGQTPIMEGYRYRGDIESFAELNSSSLNSASGQYSHAEGRSTTTDARSSHVEGENNIIKSAPYSHAEGQGNKLVGGGNDHDENSSNFTFQSYEGHVEGYLNGVHGARAHAEGSRNAASGQDAHAEGYQGQNPISVLCEVVNTSGPVIKPVSCQYSAISGASSDFYTKLFYANGNGDGETGIGIGSCTYANGNITVLLESSLPSSVSAGTHVVLANMNYGARGAYSHCEGTYTAALGSASHAEGSGTIASGSCSHAGGYQTVARSYEQFAHGAYLTANTQAGSAIFGIHGVASTYALFTVSNGTDGGPNKNAFEIFSNGEIQVNNTQKFSSITTAVTSASTNSQLPTAAACWKAITGSALTTTTADGRYLTKKSTSNSAVTASWGSSGLTIDGNASHGLLVKGSGETTRIYGGYINTTKDLTVSGNSTLKGGNTANTLTVTGSTNLKSGTTANTMYITGNFKLSSGVSANSITTAVTSSSTDQQLPTAKACYKAITGATSSYLKKSGDTATTLTATNLTMTKGLNFTLNKVFSDSNFTHNSGGYYSTSTPKAFVTFTDAYGTNEPVYIWYKSSDYPPGSIAFIQCGYHDNRDVYVAKGYSGGSTVWEKFATDNKIYMLIFSHRTFSIGSTVYASPSAYIDCSTINV